MNEDNTRINRLLAAAIADHQRGRLNDACAQYEEILNLSPGHPDATHLTGLVAFQNGDLSKARSLIEAAIRRDASVVLYHANLGRVLMAMGDHTGAAQAWSKALECGPETADIHADLSGVLLQLQDFRNALIHAEQALDIDPAYLHGLTNKALALEGLGQVDAAMDAFRVSIDRNSNNGEVWFHMAGLYQQADNLDAAEAAYKKACELLPNGIEAWNNLGNLLRDQVRFGEAVMCYEQALAIDPNHSDIHSNLGVAYQENGDTDKAIRCYREAVRRDSDNAEAHRNLGMALLQVGSYAEGWKEYEWRWQTKHFAPIVRSWEQPRWQGEDAFNQTVLVHSEQGFGDGLQFARYFPLMAAKAKKLIVEAPKELAVLLARMDGVSEVVLSGGTLPDFDLQIPMLSLPYAFQTTEETIPSSCPYLKVSGQKGLNWKQRLNKQDGEVLVGIVWKGSGDHQRNKLRSPGLQAFEPLLDLEPNVRFVSLQKADGATDISKQPKAERIEDYTSDLETFDDTAALIANLDVVVSPDTAVAHLAGGLGIPVFLMVPSVAEWRWLQNRTDSPWYPKTTLVRQQQGHDWTGVVQSIKQALV